jgi:hypothetical protein
MSLAKIHFLGVIFVRKGSVKVCPLVNRFRVVGILKSLRDLLSCFFNLALHYRHFQLRYVCESTSTTICILKMTILIIDTHLSSFHSLCNSRHHHLLAISDLISRMHCLIYQLSPTV